MMTNKLYVTILAGGNGTRMESEIPKVLHSVGDECMIVKLINQVALMNPTKILVVVGKFRHLIRAEIEKKINDDRIVYVDQPNALGTGDAVKCTLPLFLDVSLSGVTITNIILNADVPLLRVKTINEIYAYYMASSCKMLITSINLANPTGNGRIIIDSGVFKEIIEEKDCNPNQKLITLTNCGIYVVDSKVLTEFIPLITNKNAAGEYYLTDLVKIYNGTGKKIDLFVLTPDKEIEIFNVNTKQQLEYLITRV